MDVADGTFQNEIPVISFSLRGFSLTFSLFSRARSVFSDVHLHVQVFVPSYGLILPIWNFYIFIMNHYFDFPIKKITLNVAP